MCCGDLVVHNGSLGLVAAALRGDTTAGVGL